MATVDEILSRKGDVVHTVAAEASVLEATREMNFRKVGALVVRRGEDLVGILTERDVLRRVVAEGKEPSEVMVGEAMTAGLVCVSPGADVEGASEVMREKRVRYLPVCDQAGRLVGMLSMGDLNAVHASRQAETISYLNEYIYGRV